ncbi:triphosphoribosyl-dephospho-CoA synthase MdcB [Variovorax paradoxus]|jgi:triphosphoribosyl-dephospho-CoA synthase|uniref:triphosphoribosyl-dephospho-CoA synthase MdcB n=1 Tax=Variovorax paradoxus TaxID=34073 RepID=UPI0029C769B5|nr:triphosphoribosyl-dephospho-CoA synthase MdcB [Variovorax paradoxus]WPH23285.1 triphosphoribosyl-dephospho-CoA synthase MdcB [Variovorax paradoxus]
MRNLARLTATDSRLAAAAIGRAATLSLYDELSLSPKPGLVTLIDCGSHDDMDAHTFMRSLFSLRRYFVRIAEAGVAGADFAVLERLGIAAEARMLAATGGVNTHRGAIFMLGLLCAAAGAALPAHGGASDPAALRDALRRHWGEALARRSQRPPVLPGGVAARRHGLRSASEEAALAFPVLFETALPALKNALARGLAPRQARLDTLFHIIAVLDDSNLAHRGGLAGLRDAQRAAQGFLDRGGIARPEGLQEAQAIADDFVRRRLSPGGAADTLAAACWLQRVCPGS